VVSRLSSTQKTIHQQKKVDPIFILRLSMNDSSSRNIENGRISNGIDERIRNVTRGISSLIVQNIINSLLGFVFLGALLRLLPAVDYGGYSGVQVSIGIATPIALLGLSYAAVRYVSLKKQEEGDNRFAFVS
jgi:hypothetical protein